eukprot:CAMPEP_0119380858 /NCGR_PEP_ID=MMETSP1334-20130426/57964_1 /TAXON_ID=127549 /ORGANISM="Calcidiscus leptoporus, Strain RCC1130" /LENGTH=353 /DNA_ID=CAMNT_0007400801 /DNA_START=312 /DNA_END=1370 /DNA_ORIENTATION=-
MEKLRPFERPDTYRRGLKRLSTQHTSLPKRAVPSWVVPQPLRRREPLRHREVGGEAARRQRPARLEHLRLGEGGAGDDGPLEVGRHELRLLERGANQVAAQEARARQRGELKVRAFEVRACEDGALASRAVSGVGLRERFEERRPLEVGAFKGGAREVDLVELRALEVRAPEVGVAQVVDGVGPPPDKSAPGPERRWQHAHSFVTAHWFDPVVVTKLCAVVGLRRHFAPSGVGTARVIADGSSNKVHRAYPHLRPRRSIGTTDAPVPAGTRSLPTKANWIPTHSGSNAHDSWHSAMLCIDHSTCLLSAVPTHAPCLRLPPGGAHWSSQFCAVGPPTPPGLTAAAAAAAVAAAG